MADASSRRARPGRFPCQRRAGAARLAESALLVAKTAPGVGRFAAARPMQTTLVMTPRYRFHERSSVSRALPAPTAAPAPEVSQAPKRESGGRTRSGDNPEVWASASGLREGGEELVADRALLIRRRMSVADHALVQLSGLT